MQSEIKPCPFCGSDHICPSSWDIQCQGCKAMMPGEPEDASSRWNRRALTAALSDQERAVEVKASPSDVFQVLAEFYRNGQFDFGHAPEMSRRISALVDVPVEPVAWLPADEAPRGVYALIKHRSGQLDLCYKTDNGDPFLETWRYAGTAKRGEQAPWPESYIPVSALRTSPPIPHREGEDSAEVIEEGAKILAKWISYAWDGLSERDISDEYPDWSRNGIGSLGMQGGKPALRKVAAAILALAATRSASATSATGGDHVE